jgi:EAL domain-containing protein (putative c-di-GMP-specific phosphodiesterase class I)/CheY-like chemotaxis protein
MKARIVDASGPGPAPRILVAEDDPALLEVVAALLAESGYETVAVSRGMVAIDSLRSTTVDIVLTDIVMPDATGVDVLRTVREHNLDTPVILMTGNPTLPTATEALNLGAIGYLVKPVPSEKILETVSGALSLVRLTRLRRQALAEVGGENRFMADRAGLEVLLERALGGMWMAYQPLLWAKGGECYGHEALLRTSAPDIPDATAFLDVAERLGRMAELGRRIRARVAQDLAAAPGVVLVNMHPLELADPELDSGTDPLSLHADRVVLELTERAPLDGLGDLRDLGRRLRSRGFRIAVDDLGVGYAALASFASLEPDMVKLDMSLIRDVDRHPTRRKLVGSIAELCRSLGILVVAEGVETEAERDVVVELGCDLLQGFLLGRPGPLGPG